MIEYGKNKFGDLVIRDFVGDLLAADGRHEFFIAGYVGGPGAPYNAAGIFVADAELGAYRLFEERPSHLSYYGGWEVIAGGMFKSEFGASLWGSVDPLVLDLDGDGLELTGIAGEDLVFDIDGDGYAEPSGWVRADDGLLALDANADGQINDVGELFGGPGVAGLRACGDGDVEAAPATAGRRFGDERRRRSGAHDGPGRLRRHVQARGRARGGGCDGGGAQPLQALDGDSPSFVVVWRGFPVNP